MTDRAAHTAPSLKRTALGAALTNRCPRCGEGAILRGLLTPEERCAACGEDFAPHAAGDGAVFVVLTLLCFGVMAAVVVLEIALQPPVWVHLLVATGLAIGLALALLPPIKRFLIAQSMIKEAGVAQAEPEARESAASDASSPPTLSS